MASSKRTRNDENKLLVFLDSFTLAPKHPQRITESVSLADIQNLQQGAKKDAAHAESLKESLRKSTEEKQSADAKSRVERALGSVTAAGYQNLWTSW
jgi:hypothetical protein